MAVNPMLALLGLPGALLFVLSIYKPLHHLARKHVRPYIMKEIHRDLGFVARLGRSLKHPVLDTIVQICAMTVSVDFYLLALPPGAWLLPAKGPAAVIALVHCMALGTYLASAIKDVLACPRPAGMLTEQGDKKGGGAQQQQQADGATAPEHAVVAPTSNKPTVSGNEGVKLAESEMEVEWGPPSMHTWCALTLPGFWCWTLYEVFGAVSLRTALLLLGASCLWAAWMGFTRLYLGVHSPVDLKLGSAMGGAFLALWCLWGHTELALVCGTPWAVWALLAAHVALLALYPQPAAHTTSLNYSVIFLGAASGALFAVADHHRYSLFQPLVAPGGSLLPYLRAAPRAMRHPASVVLCGYLVVALVKEVSQVLLELLLPALFAQLPMSLRLKMQPAVHPDGCWRPDGSGSDAGAHKPGVLMKRAGLPYDQDFTRKFINYGLTVFVVFDLSQALHVLRAPATATS